MESLIAIFENGISKFSVDLEKGFRHESGYWLESNVPIIDLAQYSAVRKMVKVNRLTPDITGKK